MKFILFDREENYIKNLRNVLEAKHTEEINGEDVLEITTLDHGVEKGYKVAYKSKHGYWNEFTVAEVEEFHTEEGLGMRLFCESTFYETLGDYVEDKRPYNTSANIALANALLTTRWEVGIVHDLGLSSTNFYHISAKEAVQKVAEAWKGEIRTRVDVAGNKITHRYVDMLAQRGGDFGKRFTYTKGLESIVKTVHREDVITALYGYGKGEHIEETDGYGRRINFADLNNGKAYVENNEARAIWGRNNPDGTKSHIFSKVEYDDCEDPEELLQLTTAELAEVSKPLITYECGVIDLGDAELGDNVVVIDREFIPELRLKARVVKIVRDLLNNENNKLLLGNFIPSIIDTLNQQQEHINNFRSRSGVWDRANTFNPDGFLNAQYLENLIDEMNTRMNSQGGYVYVSEDGKGLITYDKPADQNPTMAVQILGGAIRVAASKNPDGSFAWRTFITGRDITADLINTGILQGGKVRFDLTHGTFSIGDTDSGYSLRWDGSKLYINGLGIESYASKTYVGQTIANEIIDINQNMEYKIHIGEKPPQMVVGYFLSPNQVLEEIELDKKRKWLDTRGTPILRRWDEEEQDWVACSATSLDELDSEASIMLTTHESTITQHANEIATKVSQVDFDALGNIVSSQGSTITQHANEIATKVSQVDFDALGNIVSSQGSTITQLSGEIITKVEKNGVISAINQTSESIKISASKISLVGAVSVLSDISGDLGSITAGTITGVTFQTAASGNRLVISGNVITGYQSGTKRLVIDYKGTNFYCPNGSLTGYLIGEYDTTYDLRTLKISTPSPKSYDLYANIVMESNEIDLRAYNNHWASTIKSSLLMDGVSATISLGQKTPLHAYYWGGVGINKYWERGGLDVSGDIYTDGTIKAEKWGNINYYLHVGTVLYVGSYLSIKNTKFDVDVNYNNVFRLSPEGSNWALRIGTSSAGCVWKALGGPTRAWQARDCYDSGYVPIYATDFIATSKKEFKENIKLAESALKQVLETPVYNFVMKDKGRPRIGLVYEEAPETLRSIDGLSISDMVGMLWKAVQELNEKVEVKGGINLEN